MTLQSLAGLEIMGYNILESQAMLETMDYNTLGERRNAKIPHNTQIA
jgi:hypothetical protein